MQPFQILDVYLQYNIARLCKGSTLPRHKVKAAVQFRYRRQNSEVEKLVSRLAHNQKVTGSSPVLATYKYCS